MDIHSHIGLSLPDVINSPHGLCMDTLESTPRVAGDISVDELGNGVTEFLNIQDERGSVSILPSVKCGVAKKDVCGENNFSTITSEKCLSKCATFPCPGKNLSSAAASVGGGVVGAAKDGCNDTTTEELTHNDNAKSVTPSCSRSLSLPTPLKLISAMKGNREKQQGALPMNLTVKWAPDVYDPIPTSVSHVVSNNKPQRHSSKKNAKNKKGGSSKSSHGTKGKDKKQSRKHGGSSNRSFKLLEHDEQEMIGFCEPQTSAVDFHVGNPDQFCGSSFLKRYVPSLHFSVAEAT